MSELADDEYTIRTWGDFKRVVESVGVTDATPLGYIDINSTDVFKILEDAETGVVDIG